MILRTEFYSRLFLAHVACGAGTPARENSVDVGASVRARALWDGHDFRACPEREPKGANPPSCHSEAASAPRACPFSPKP